MRLLQSLAKATQQRQIRPAGDLDRVSRLLAQSVDLRLRTTAAGIAGLWKVEQARNDLESIAGSNETPEELRRAAMEGLALIADPISLATLSKLCLSDQLITTRQMAVSALAGADLDTAATHAIDVLQTVRTDAECSEVFRSFLERKTGPAVLSAALARRSLPQDAAKIGIRLARISGRDQEELVQALSKAGGLSAGLNQLSDEEVQKLTALVSEQGNPQRGEEIFRRADLNCLKCHSVAGAGGQAGPDLISIGASAQIDYLIESLVDPNKKVKEGFHSVVVATSDGRVLTGIKLRQTDTELVLRNAEDQEVTVPLRVIEEQKTGGSIMPSGLTDSLTQPELVDLVSFLSKLGKSDGPFAISPIRVARRWHVLEPTSDTVREIEHHGLATATHDTRFRWTSVYSKVSGDLPVSVFQSSRIPHRNSEVGVARCYLEAATPGAIKLRLNSANGLRIWLDKEPIEAREELALDLAAGRHTVTIVIDLNRRSNDLRCELDDVAGSRAQGQFLTN
jgi:putative heme-binding domain-containing protein